MKKNMGNTDRMIRVLIAIAIAILSYTNVISGTLELILLVVACIFALTSFIRFCPLYTLFGINTCKTK